MAALALGLAVAACSGRSAPPTGDRGHYDVYLRSAGGVAKVTTDGRPPATFSPGVITPDGKTLITIEHSPLNVTTLGRQPLGGPRLTGDSLLGAYDPPPVAEPLARGTYADWPVAADGFSPNGRFLTLERRIGSGRVADAIEWAVSDVTTLKAPAVFQLPPSFGFLAVSDDGLRLYLREDLGGGSFQVRLFRVLAGALDDKPAGGPFEGDHLASVGVEGRQFAIVRPAGPGPVYVLVVDPAKAAISKLGLPAGFEAGAPWLLGLSASKHELYLINADAGRAAIIDTRALRVTRAATFQSRALGGFVTEARAKEEMAGVVRPHAAVIGSMLFAPLAGHDILELDVKKMRRAGLIETSSEVRQVAASPDGKRLFAVIPPPATSVQEFDTRTGRRVAELGAGYAAGPGEILAVTAGADRS